MKLLGQLGFTALVAVSAIAVTPACTENSVSIFVHHNLAPPQNRQNGSCVYTPDPTAAFNPEGLLDTALRVEYQTNLIAGSQLIARGDQTQVRAESNRVNINGAVVKVTDANGASLGEFTALTSGFLDIALNNQPGYGIVAVTAIDAPTGARIRDSLSAAVPSRLVVANIKIFGKTLGGVDVESGEFQYPIRVCRGCSISFEVGDDPAAQGIDCGLPLATGAGAGGGSTLPAPCSLGQDEGVNCQLCSKDFEACRAPIALP